MWGIWCKDARASKGDWLRCHACGNAVLVFETARLAMRHAANEYGFAFYSEAKRRDWCEVRRLGN